MVTPQAQSVLGVHGRIEVWVAAVTFLRYSNHSHEKKSKILKSCGY